MLWYRCGKTTRTAEDRINPKLASNKVGPIRRGPGFIQGPPIAVDWDTLEYNLEHAARSQNWPDNENEYSFRIIGLDGRAYYGTIASSTPNDIDWSAARIDDVVEGWLLEELLDLGFEEVDTGGGTMAMMLALPGDHAILVTNGMNGLPDETSSTDVSYYEHYSTDANSLASKDFQVGEFGEVLAYIARFITGRASPLSLDRAYEEAISKNEALELDRGREQREKQKLEESRKRDQDLVEKWRQRNAPDVEA
jgi:hypothetical protein